MARGCLIGTGFDHVTESLHLEEVRPCSSLFHSFLFFFWLAASQSNTHTHTATASSHVHRSYFHTDLQALFIQGSGGSSGPAASIIHPAESIDWCGEERSSAQQSESIVVTSPLNTQRILKWIKATDACNMHSIKTNPSNWNAEWIERRHTCCSNDSWGFFQWKRNGHSPINVTYDLYNSSEIKNVYIFERGHKNKQVKEYVSLFEEKSPNRLYKDILRFS